jgi:hypothetical protein
MTSTISRIEDHYFHAVAGPAHLWSALCQYKIPGDLRVRFEVTFEAPAMK